MLSWRWLCSYRGAVKIHHQITELEADTYHGAGPPAANNKVQNKQMHFMALALYLALLLIQYQSTEEAVTFNGVCSLPCLVAHIKAQKNQVHFMVLALYLVLLLISNHRIRRFFSYLVFRLITKHRWRLCFHGVGSLLGLVADIKAQNKQMHFMVLALYLVLLLISNTE